MDMSYPAVEERIKDAIEAFYSRENPNRSAIAREFNVPPERLRSRLSGRPSQSEVRGLHNRLLSPDRDKALVLFFQRLSNAGTPARLNSIKKKPFGYFVKTGIPQNHSLRSDRTGPNDGWIGNQTSSKSKGILLQLNKKMRTI